MIKGEVKENYVSVKEVAERLSVHKSFVYRLITSHQIETIRLSERRVVIPERALNQFIDAHKVSVI